MKYDMYPEISLEQVLERIEYASDYEIDEMINAVTRRYRWVFPDWEVMFLSVPISNSGDQKRQVEGIVNFLRRNYLE